jgi:hypothetical protein
MFDCLRRIDLFYSFCSRGGIKQYQLRHEATKFFETKSSSHTEDILGFTISSGLFAYQFLDYARKRKAILEKLFYPKPSSEARNGSLIMRLLTSTGIENENRR